jgi:hypothetical protein
MEKLSKPKAQVGEQHTNTCTKQQQASVVKAEQKNRKKTQFEFIVLCTAASKVHRPKSSRPNSPPAATQGVTLLQ